jgi:hypothetical protein
MANPESSLTHKVLSGSLYGGMLLDGINKIGTKVFDKYPLGHGTVLENHIGNFGTSAVLTSLVRNGAFNFLEDNFDLHISNNVKNVIAFTTIGLANLIVESAPILSHDLNPEFFGDLSVGLISSLLFLLSYPEENISFFD